MVHAYSAPSDMKEKVKRHISKYYNFRWMFSFINETVITGKVAAAWRVWFAADTGISVGCYKGHGRFCKYYFNEYSYFLLLKKTTCCKKWMFAACCSNPYCCCSNFKFGRSIRLPKGMFHVKFHSNPLITFWDIEICNKLVYSSAFCILHFAATWESEHAAPSLTLNRW